MKPRNKPDSWLQLQVSKTTGLPTGSSVTRAYSHTVGDVHFYSVLATDEGVVKKRGFMVGYWEGNVLRLFSGNRNDDWMGDSEVPGTIYSVVDFDSKTASTWIIDENNRVTLDDAAVVEPGVNDGP